LEKIKVGTLIIEISVGDTEVVEEIIYTLDDHLKGKSEDMKILFEALKERIFALNGNYSANNDVKAG